MSTYHPRRLCRPDILRAIDSDYLSELLVPYAAALARHGITLPLAGREAPLKYMALAQLLMAPERGLPPELVDAMYYIDELATPTGIEALEEAGKALGIEIPQYLEVTPAEIALKYWLADRQLVERVHAELAVERMRAFEYFQPKMPELPELTSIWQSRIEELEDELNDGFHARHYGRYARVIINDQEDCLWLYVGHGGLLRREATVTDSGPSSICYRPEVYDALVYVKATGELGIHSGAEWQRALYQRVVGKHLFNDERLFSGRAKYTLDPLWDYGCAAMQWLDVPGIEWVRLTHLSVFQPGRLPMHVNYRSEDLFTHWGQDMLPFSETARLVSASMQVKVAGRRAPCRVTLRPSNRAEYSRDVDRHWIETWLERRGFIRRQGENHAVTQSLLSVA